MPLNLYYIKRSTYRSPFYTLQFLHWFLKFVMIKDLSESFLFFFIKVNNEKKKIWREYGAEKHKTYRDQITSPSSRTKIYEGTLRSGMSDNGYPILVQARSGIEGLFYSAFFFKKKNLNVKFVVNFTRKTWDLTLFFELAAVAFLNFPTKKIKM